MPFSFVYGILISAKTFWFFPITTVGSFCQSKKYSSFVCFKRYSSTARLKYGFVDYFNLPEEPVVERSFFKGGKEINIFKLSKICGTCIAKDKAKGTVTLLTPTGVVTVKFRKEYFSMFDKQISERGADGVKHVIEKSWFNRGSMIVVQGIRSGDAFVAKKYASSGGHQLYKITEVFPNGEIALQTERYQGGYEENGED